jgi:hypothetical protein
VKSRCVARAGSTELGARSPGSLCAEQHKSQSLSGEMAGCKRRLGSRWGRFQRSPNVHGALAQAIRVERLDETMSKMSHRATICR